MQPSRGLSMLRSTRRSDSVRPWHEWRFVTDCFLKENDDLVLTGLAADWHSVLFPLNATWRR